MYKGQFSLTGMFLISFQFSVGSYLFCYTFFKIHLQDQKRSLYFLARKNMSTLFGDCSCDVITETPFGADC